MLLLLLFLSIILTLAQAQVTVYGRDVFLPYLCRNGTRFDREFDEHSTRFCDLCKIYIKTSYGREGNWRNHNLTEWKCAHIFPLRLTKLIILYSQYHMTCRGELSQPPCGWFCDDKCKKNAGFHVGKAFP